jgi:zinc transport system permease protein
LALLVMMAAAIAVAVEGLGALLVLAVLVGPPVAVRRHVRNPGAAMLAGGGVAAAAGVAGIQLSAQAGTAAGASVALVLCAAAGLGALLPARRLG